MKPELGSILEASVEQVFTRCRVTDVVVGMEFTEEPGCYDIIVDICSPGNGITCVLTNISCGIEGAGGCVRGNLCTLVTVTTRFSYRGY